MRVNLLRKIEFDGDKATVRVFVAVRAVDTETGREAEGFGEMDHLLRLVKEDGTWKFWQVQETAEDLALELLTAKDEKQRVELLSTKGQPYTGGLIKGLADQAQRLTEEKGDYAGATSILVALLTIAKQNDSPLGIGNALVGLGDVYSAQGDYMRAADNYQQVLTLAENLKSKEGIAAVSVKMGNIHYAQGNYPLAMEYYLRSLRSYEELGSKIEIAYPLLSIGNAFFSQGDYRSALEYYGKSLKIYEAIFDKAGTAYLLGRIAEVQAAQGKLAEAFGGYEKSLKLQEELGNKAMAAYALNNSGKVRYAEGNFREAVSLSTRAVALARDANNPEILWQTLTTKGRALYALKDREAAGGSFADAIAIIEQLRQKVVGDEQDQQLSFENRTVPYHAMIDLLIERRDWAGAFAYAERAKGRVLLDVIQSGRENINRAMTAGEREQERVRNESITGLNSQLRRESLRSSPDRQRVQLLESDLKNARLEYEAFQTRLFASHPELKIQRGQSTTLDLAGVKDVLTDSSTAVLEYVVTGEKVYLFVITRSEAGADGNSLALKVYPIDISPKDLASRITKLREKISGNALGFREPSRELYDLLLKPAQTQLAEKTNVCVIPDGPLWELPFQALISSENKYVIEEHSIYYAPSLSVLREMKKRASQGPPIIAAQQANLGRATTSKGAPNPSAGPRMLLAFGNPELNETMVSRAKSINRDESLGPLPEAEREVKSLTQFYLPSLSKILVGADAREETFKAEAGNFRVLHFATHGTLDDSNPMYSRLVLANTSEGEDGFLEAREIIKLNLHADLVVLSACQTARGRVAQGEGLIGMTWAFFVAGSPTTVASQWKVDSASTTQLMTNFHQLLTAPDSKTEPQMSKAEALRRAALKLLADERYRHPFYWAGFVMMGDGG